MTASLATEFIYAYTSAPCRVTEASQAARLGGWMGCARHKLHDLVVGDFDFALDLDTGAALEFTVEVG